MRKFLSVLLAVVVLVSVTACQSSASQPTKSTFDLSKEAYNLLTEDCTKVEEFADDIYEAWRMGIHEKESLSLNYLSGKLNVSLDSLKLGFAYTLNQSTWKTMSEDEKNSAKLSAEKDFTAALKLVDSVFSFCVEIITNSYIANGTSDMIKEDLDKARIIMKEMSEKYSDYEHYPALKGYYTNTSAWYEFCLNPTGSFDQLRTTIDDYRNKSREFKSDLDFVFKDI